MTAVARGERFRARRRLRRRQLVVLEVLAQAGLEDLAGGAVRDRFDELHVVGHPPFGDLALQERENIVLGDAAVGPAHDHWQWALVPIWVGHAGTPALAPARA